MHLEKGRPQLNGEKFNKLLHKEMPELSSLAEIAVEKIFFEDSSDIHPHHWVLLSRAIRDAWHAFDGFVVLHGTDTMAYTASALSFSLRNLNKPVILTGSQVPMSNIRSDARRNLINAVELATHPICEVAVCFNDHLYRGNRCSKMSIGDFDAFASPNFPPLADIGTSIQLHQKWTPPVHDLHCNAVFDHRVAVLKLHPGLSPAWLQCLDFDQVKAVILEGFGSGNFSIKGEFNLLPFIETCREHGVHVIITSQAPYDSVDLSMYQSGREAKKLGALSAGDMTMEAILTKTMHLLGNKLADEAFKSQFEQTTAGERSR